MPTTKSIHRTQGRRSIFTLAGALVALLLVSGCVRTAPPVQEMSDARQAVAAAREAGADRLAPQAFRRAVSLLGNAEKTLERRRYKQARDQALASRRLAIEAMENAATQALREAP